MKILVACEFSGIVRDAFSERGHEAWSCDLLPSERPFDNANTFHMQCDVMELFGPHRLRNWDLMIAFPPCTHLAVSGARWFKGKEKQRFMALVLIWQLMRLPCPRIAIENPIGIVSTFIRKPDQIIQPWQFGHGETKATCLWLKNLPKLVPTDIVEGRDARVHKCPPGKDRWKERSRTLTGIAKAMAEQWG